MCLPIHLENLFSSQSGYNAFIDSGSYVRIYTIIITTYLDVMLNNCFISPVAVEALLFVASFIDLNVA